MPEKQRLSAVLDERIKAKGADGRAALKDIRSLSKFDPDVLAAISTDAAKRGMSIDQGLEMARKYVEDTSTSEDQKPAAKKQEGDHQEGDSPQ